MIGCGNLASEKSLWEPLLGFHRDVISTPSSPLHQRARDRNEGMLHPYRRADRRSWRLFRSRFRSIDVSNRSMGRLSVDYFHSHSAAWPLPCASISHSPIPSTLFKRALCLMKGPFLLQ